MTIFHVIKYPTTTPIKVSSLPAEVSKSWTDRVEAYRSDVVGKMSPDNVIHLNHLYAISPRSNAFEILKACLESVVEAAELIDWANLGMDYDTVQNRKSAAMKIEAAKFISWLQEELLKYEGPL